MDVNEDRLREDIEINATFAEVEVENGRGRTVLTGTEPNREAREHFVKQLEEANMDVRVDAVGNIAGRWSPPSATRIGRADSPDHDVSENVRRLHDERHPAMEGYSERAHRLEKLRLTHALCSNLELTSWQRDRAIGTMIDLDLTAFGSQRAIPKVALVVIRHVVDHEREHHLGLHDDEWITEQPPERLGDLYEQFRSITDDEQFTALCEQHGLGVTNLNRLQRTLTEQLDEQDLHDAVYGRNPYRDPSLPSLGAGTSA